MSTGVPVPCEQVPKDARRKHQISGWELPYVGAEKQTGALCRSSECPSLSRLSSSIILSLLCSIFLLYTRFTARSWECMVTLTHLPTLKEGKPLTHCLKFSQNWPLSLVLPKLFYPVIPKLNVPECVSIFGLVIRVFRS